MNRRGFIKALMQGTAAAMIGLKLSRDLPVIKPSEPEMPEGLFLITSTPNSFDDRFYDMKAINEEIDRRIIEAFQLPEHLIK